MARAIVEAWVRQLAAGLTLPLALALALTLVNRATQGLLVRTFGWSAVVYLTGWIGTPIHEASHWLVGLPFLRFREVVLFRPDPEDGVLGYVRYDHEPEKPHYHVGRFLSSVAPLFGGALCLLAALRLVLPSPAQVFDAASRFADVVRGAEVAALRGATVDLVRSTWGAVLGGPLADFRPWLFLYLALAIGAHLAPSRTDWKGALPGFLVTLVLLLLVDAGLVVLGADPGRITRGLAVGSGAASAVLVVALVVNLGNLGLSAALALVVPRRRGG